MNRLPCNDETLQDINLNYLIISDIQGSLLL
jgi:hypothetical protein